MNKNNIYAYIDWFTMNAVLFKIIMYDETIIIMDNLPIKNKYTAYKELEKILYKGLKLIK